MKRRTFSTPSKEIQDVFNYEWSRAKRILSPYLDRKKRPQLYTATGLDGAVGWHLGRDGLYATRLASRWVRNPHSIALKEGRTMEQMKHTMRHEIVHVIEQNHGSRFKLLLRGLEQGREIEERLISGN